jgi:hypothetical protein
VSVRGTVNLGSSAECVPFRESAEPARRIYAEKEHQMKKVKDLNASIAVLQAMLRRDDTQSEQKQEIEAAIKSLKVLRRLGQPTRAQMFRQIREIIDRILRALLR